MLKKHLEKAHTHQKTHPVAKVWGKLKHVTEVWHMAHFWVSYGRCTMPGSPMGRSEGLSRCWAG